MAGHMEVTITYNYHMSVISSNAVENTVMLCHVTSFHVMSCVMLHVWRSNARQCCVTWLVSTVFSTWSRVNLICRAAMLRRTWMLPDLIVIVVDWVMSGAMAECWNAVNKDDL